MRETVHIVAVSARTPIGLLAESAAAAARTRVTRIEEHPFLATQTGKQIYCGLDPHLDARAGVTERMARLGLAALAELARKLGGWGGEMPLYLNLPETRPGWSSAEAAQIVEFIQGNAHPSIGTRVVTPLGQGHAGALQALARGADEILRGTCDLCVVGGVESYIDAATLRWLDQSRRLGGGAHRSGLIPSEGAAFVALASPKLVASLRLTSLGRLCSYGHAIEERVIAGGEDPLGEGLSQAISHALASASPRLVDDVYCDLNGERYRTEEWGFCVLRVQEHLRFGGEWLAATDCWGDMGAASGALSCVLAVRAWARGYARGPRALLWGSSDQGLRAALLLEAP